MLGEVQAWKRIKQRNWKPRSQVRFHLRARKLRKICTEKEAYSKGNSVQNSKATRDAGKKVPSTGLTIRVQFREPVERWQERTNYIHALWLVPHKNNKQQGQRDCSMGKCAHLCKPGDCVCFPEPTWRWKKRISSTKLSFDLHTCIWVLILYTINKIIIIIII